MAVKYDCVSCRKQVTATKNNRYRSHTNGDGDNCDMSSVEIPEHLLGNPVGEDDKPDVPRDGVDFAVCGECDRKVPLTRLGYFERHTETLRGDVSCPVGGTRYRPEETVESPLLTEPGTSEVPKVRDSARLVGTGSAEPTPPVEAAVIASEGVSATAKANLERTPMEPASPESTTTSTPSEPSTEASPIPSSGSGGPFHLAPLLDEKILQPFSYVSQPFPVPDKVTLKEALGPEGKERAVRFREIFFSYNNRRSSDNRSAQTTLGPSEIGYECDRRLAMSLMGVDPVNPGGDGWAAWLGTQGHRGLDEMFSWASANSGRFLTETRVQLPSRYVPKGTADLFDRVQAEVGDFKFMGEYSLKKLIQEGPPQHYQVQLDVYGLGVELMGEKVRSVALYGLPRAGSSLDGMYVWTKPYDRKAAKAALKRVDDIAAEVEKSNTDAGLDIQVGNMRVAQQFETGPEYECRFCPFFLKGDKKMERGCPGK